MDSEPKWWKEDAILVLTLIALALGILVVLSALGVLLWLLLV